MKSHRRAKKLASPHADRDAIPFSMPKGEKKGDRPSDKVGQNKLGGSTLCALCGSTMKAGSVTSQEPVIYSICATCKKMPHRNPGSIESLC
jgi:hypothetical protein